MPIVTQKKERKKERKKEIQSMRETKTHITCYTTHYTFCKLNKDTFTRSKPHRQKKRFTDPSKGTPKQKRKKRKKSTFKQRTYWRRYTLASKRPVLAPWFASSAALTIRTGFFLPKNNYYYRIAQSPEKQNGYKALCPSNKTFFR
jgi:hypothetical protein